MCENCGHEGQTPATKLTAVPYHLNGRMACKHVAAGAKARGYTWDPISKMLGGTHVACEECLATCAETGRREGEEYWGSRRFTWRERLRWFFLRRA